jgi:hypothetical protein
MKNTELRKSQPSAKKVKTQDGNKEDSGVKEEIIERYEIPNSPFEVITTNGQSFGTMGNYRLTNPGTKKEIKKELEKITWNRIIQVTMILHVIFSSSFFISFLVPGFVNL